jgi:hypothetical protein
MKFLRVSVAALAALTVSFSVKAQTVDEIINKHIDALGGKEKISAMKSLYTEAEMDIMGTAAPSATTILYGVGSYSEVNFNGQKIVNCFTDKGAWGINPLMGQATAEDLPEEQAKSGKSQLFPGGNLFDYAARGNKVELAGQEDVNGVKAWKLTVTTKDGGRFVHFIDPTSFYIIRTVMKVNAGGQEVEQGINFSDYKKTDYGFVVPYASSIEFGNGMTLGVTVKKVEINKAVDPKIFNKP